MISRQLTVHGAVRAVVGPDAETREDVVIPAAEDGRLDASGCVITPGLVKRPPPAFEALAEVAARRGLRRRTQAGEQVDTVIAAERYGRRPIELVARLSERPDRRPVT